MRVVQPKSKRPAQHTRSRKPFAVAAGLVLIAVASVSGYLYTRSNADAAKQVSATAVLNQNIVPATKKGTLKTFTGEQFKDLYNSFAYPNTQRINETTPITDNESADVKIRQIAVMRGYALRSAPVTNAFQDVGEGYKLQQRAAQPWLDLVAEAKKDSVNLGLTAAYRSAEDQKQLFLERLSQQNIPIAGIAAGTYDSQISQVLRTTAVPGYSRHHTGYTIDIACKDMPTTSFMYTNCFKWLSANNYEKTKKHGWIPSYPEGTENQGPDPESWEYVWVGSDAVTE